MKTLFLILFTFFSLRLSSQVITLTSYKSETLFKEGNYIDSNFTQILNTESVFSSYGKITKVLDLDFGSALLIEDGNLINTNVSFNDNINALNE